MPTLVCSDAQTRGIRLALALSLLMVGRLIGQEAVPPVAQQPVAQEPIPSEVLGNYYRSGGRMDDELLEQSQAPVQPSGLPLPQSWTNTFIDPQPRLELRAEVDWLQPNFNNSFPLAQQTLPNGGAFAYQQQPTGVWGPGQMIATPKGTVEYHWNEQGSAELSGFYMDGPQQSNYALGNSDQTYYFNGDAGNATEKGYLYNIPAGFPSTATDAFVDWNFRTWGAEVNLLHHFICMQGSISDLAVGIGGRYLQVDENVSLRVSNELDQLSATMSSKTSNHIAGPQFIGRARLNGPFRWIRWTAEGKIGLMANANQFKNTLQTGLYGPAQFSDVTTNFSPLFEGNFGCEVYVWHNIVVFGGYNLLFVDRVNRSGGHFHQDLNYFVNQQQDLGSLFLYGPRLGALVTF